MFSVFQDLYYKIKFYETLLIFVHKPIWLPKPRKQKDKEDPKRKPPKQEGWAHERKPFGVKTSHWCNEVVVTKFFCRRLQ